MAAEAPMDRDEHRESANGTPPRRDQGGELDLVVMLEALNDVRSKWYNIGLYLKVNKGTLDAIKSQFGDPREQLREMLSEWLKTYPYSSWELLIAALKSPIVGENHQADTLEQRYLSRGVQSKEESSCEEPGPSKKRKTREEAFNGDKAGKSDQDEKAEELAKQNLRVIKAKFAYLQTKVCTGLQKNLSRNQIKELRLFAITYSSSAVGIPNSTRLSEIFEAITINSLWSYREYYLLQAIVDTFGGSAAVQMKGLVEAYQEDLSGFQIATKIKHFIGTTRSDRSRFSSQSNEPLSPKQREPAFISELSWKLKEKVADYSLAYLEELWTSFARHSSLPPLTALLDTVQEGCVCVTWLIRSSLAFQLMETASDLVVFFREHPFLMVSVDGKCIFERQPTEKGEKLQSEYEQEGPPTTSGASLLASDLHPYSIITPKPSHVQAGYECEFVEPPPEAFQTECPICINIFRDPQQATCCGNNFCRTCIEQVQSERKPCPSCNQPFRVFPNKGLKRSLNQLRVRCTQQQSGCNWVGELGDLDRHLNLTPRPGELLTGCEYNEIQCEFKDAGCDTQLPRKEMAIHMKKEQTHHVQLLSEKLTKTTRNLEQMEAITAMLQHKCEDLTQHQQEVTRKCQYREQHMNQRLQVLDQSRQEEVTQMKQQVQELQLQLRNKDVEIAQLKEMSKRELKQVSQSSYSLPPQPMQVNHCFTLDEFELNKENDAVWYSEPFYTHPKGYKIRAQVCANGYGEAKGNHVTVSTCIMRGKNDDQLPWPFRGDIVVELLNQNSDKDEGHHVQMIEYGDDIPKGYADRIMSQHRTENYGLGNVRFIPHFKLNPKNDPTVQYLKDDCLKFRIREVKLNIPID